MKHIHNLHTFPLLLIHSQSSFRGTRKMLLSQTAILRFFANLILWAIFLVVYFIPLCLLILIRFAINVLVTRKSPELTPLSPNDILIVREEPEIQPACYGGSILRVEGNLDFDHFYHSFCQLFLRGPLGAETDPYENFYCDVVKRCGYLFKRKLFDHSDLSFARNLFTKKPLPDQDRMREELTFFFQQKPLLGHPLWGILILQGENVTWIAFKIHHALADGYSINHILEQLCFLQPDILPLSKEEPAFTKWKELRLFLSLPFRTFSYLFQNSGTEDPFLSSNVAPLTDLRVLKMPMSLASVNLPALRKIRRKLGVHFPSIVYSLQVGALARSFPKLESEAVLLSSSLPVKGHPKRGLLNRWSGGTVRIPFREDCALKRLRETDATFRRRLEGEGPYLIWKYIAWVPYLIPAFLNYKISLGKLGLHNYRTEMSCLPQALLDREYKLLGSHKVLNIFHAPVLKDCLPHAVLLGCSSSYNGRLDLTFFGHPNLFPNQGEMDKVMSHGARMELEDLLEKCGIEKEKLDWEEKFD